MAVIGRHFFHPTAADRCGICRLDRDTIDPRRWTPVHYKDTGVQPWDW